MAEQNPELISYLVQVHFVLKAWDENKYEAVYTDMAKAGLHRQHTNGSGLKDTLPKGVAMGLFTGYNAGDVTAFVRNAVLVVLANLKLQADVSIIAGERAAWVVFKS
jgi:homospermidine synthase